MTVAVRYAAFLKNELNLDQGLDSRLRLGHADPRLLKGERGVAAGVDAVCGGQRDVPSVASADRCALGLGNAPKVVDSTARRRLTPLADRTTLQIEIL